MINRNYAFSNQYELYIPDWPRVNPDVLQYFNTNILKCNIPGIKMGTFQDSYMADQMTFTELGDNANQFPFSIDFLVDEYYTNYQIAWRYIQDYKSGWPSRDQFTRRKDFIIRRIIVWGLDNNKNRVIEWELLDNQLINISGINYNSTSDAQVLSFNTSWLTTHINVHNVRGRKWNLKDQNIIT